MDRQRTGEITVAGRTVPVYYEDNSGRMVVPSEVEREIVLGFIGRALATPVTAITIVAMGAYRDIRLSYERIATDINVEIYQVRMQAEQKKMNAIFRTFGSEISKLDDNNYPSEVKQSYADTLKRRMEERFKSIREE